MTTESVDHEAALRLIHSGKIFAGRPAWGSWVLYGLGTERQDLPAYVVLSDPGGLPVDGTQQLVARLPAGGLPGDAVPRRRARRSPTSRRPADVPAAARAQPARLPRRAERAPTCAGTRATPSWRPGSPTTSWPRGCRRPCPRCSTCRARPTETRRLYGLDNPTTARVRQALPAGPAAGRAGRAVRAGLPERPAVGHAQQERRDA